MKRHAALGSVIRIHVEVPNGKKWEFRHYRLSKGDMKFPWAPVMPEELHNFTVALATILVGEVPKADYRYIELRKDVKPISDGPRGVPRNREKSVKPPGKFSRTWATFEELAAIDPQATIYTKTFGPSEAGWGYHWIPTTVDKATQGFFKKVVPALKKHFGKDCRIIVGFE